MAQQKTNPQGRCALKTLSMALGAVATSQAHAQAQPADNAPVLAPVTVQADAPPYKA
jgi:catecholate siderophore receptor